MWQLVFCALAAVLALGATIQKAYAQGGGIITTVAGNGVAGFSGDGGPATSASLSIPVAVALDSAGNLYITDGAGYRIRKVSTAGIITTVAGNGNAGGFSGDGGPATSASLNQPQGVVLDTAGNLYIADNGNYRIRKVSTAGIITTVAGNGDAGGFSGDGGPATSASLTSAVGVTLDTSGNLYISEFNGHRIRKVNTAGIITTVAGNGVQGFSGDNGAATSARLNSPAGMALDSAGNLYISDANNDRIRKVNTAGIITTVAGNGVRGFAGDGGLATSASLNYPVGTAVDAAGNLYVSEFNNNRVRKVTAGSGTTPSISSILPSSVPLGQTTTLTVNGSSFQSGFSATVLTSGGTFPIAAAGLTFVSSNQIMVQVTMGGTPPYTATLQITNPGGGSATGTFQVVQPSTAPTITSANSTTFTVGTAGTFPVTATGTPTPTLSETVPLPSGVTFNTTTGVLSGTPASETFGTYPITFTASNGVTPNAVQNFTLTVNPAPAPALTVSPISINFGDVVWVSSNPPITTSSQKTVMLTNTGTAPLTISSATINDSATYSVFAPQCPAPLAPGASCSATVEFHPTAIGPANAGTMSFTTNASSNPTVSLSGNGILKSACPDADGDGLCDDWESNGVIVRVNGTDHLIPLDKMGANPNHKDIFVQTDWMLAPATQNSNGHSHKPNPDAMQDIVKAFAAVPNSLLRKPDGTDGNPDGADGINLHVDCGPNCGMKPEFSAATSFPETTYMYTAPACNLCSSPDTWVLFDILSTTFLNSGRSLIFHHAIFGHNQDCSAKCDTAADINTSTGLSSGIGASKIMVTLGGFPGGIGSELQQAGTLMHELGHNLGLQHGGNVGSNYKPNYLSVMNYAFQFTGLIRDGSEGPLSLDYSRFVLPALDEGNLNELLGLGVISSHIYGTRWFCKNSALEPLGVPNHHIEDATGYIDWNCDGYYAQGVTEDLNGVPDVNGGRFIDVLAQSQTDWDKLVYVGGDLAGLPPASSSQATSAAATDIPILEMTFEEASAIKPLTQVLLTHPSIVSLAPSSSAILTLVVSNTGSKADSYTFSATPVPGWLDASSLPPSVSLQPGTSQTIQVTVSAPQNAAAGTMQQLTLAIQSQTWQSVSDSAQIYISVTSTPAALNLSVAAMFLPTQSVGTSGQPSSAILTNTGGAAINIASITISGDFSQTNNCGAALAIGASCVVQVTFVPTTDGTRTGSLTINDDAPGNPHVITLQGLARLPAPTDTDPNLTSISPSSATMGAAGFTLTVNGTNFNSTSAVQWNGSSRATTFVSSTQLTAAILASDITPPGTVGVTVFNLIPNGLSNALAFTVNAPVGGVYLVGDAYPASSDIIGGFGDNVLNNLDLIYALRAVTKVPGFTPLACSDRFDAMDSFPLDTATVRGGDGALNNLDLIETLRRVTKIDNSLPVRSSRGLACTASATQFALQGQGREGSPSSESPGGAIELGEAESTPDGLRVPVYLRATRDLVLASLSFSLGTPSSASSLQFISGDAPPPTLIDSGVQGVLALAWLQGEMHVSVGQRLLLGYAIVPGMGIEAGTAMQVYGANASDADGANTPLSFPNPAPAPALKLPSL